MDYDTKHRDSVRRYGETLMGKRGKRRAILRADPLEIFDGRKTLAALVSVFGFAALFLGSPAQLPATNLSVGSADVRTLSLEDQDGSVALGETASDEEIPKDEGLWYQVYVVRKGDTLSQLAEEFDVTVDTLVSFNEVRNSRALRIGAHLKVPNMNGILYDVADGDTLDSVAAKYEISPDRMAEVNRLPEGALPEGKRLFLPDARLSSFTLREINGDLFKWPIRPHP